MTVRPLSTLLGAVLWGSAALGATVTWSAGADGNWSTGANWTGGVPVAGDAMVFP